MAIVDRNPSIEHHGAILAIPRWLRGSRLRLLYKFDAVGRRGNRSIVNSAPHVITPGMGVSRHGTTAANIGSDWKSGAPGQYLELRGSVKVNTNSKLVSWAELTFAAVIRHGNSADNYIFSDYVAAAQGSTRLKWASTGSLLEFYKHDGAAESVVASLAFAAEQWHLVSGDWGPLGMSIYVDGEREGNGTTAGHKTAGAASVSDLQLNYDEDPVADFGATDFGFFAIWDKQLRASDHRALHRGLKGSLL